MQMIEDRDRILGSMVGGAVGDALGYAVDSMSWNEIVARYGEHGIARYESNATGVAEISSGTQMALFVANGLMLGDTYISDKGMGSPHNYDWQALKAWHLTQTQQFEISREKYWNLFWLLDESRLYALRSPEPTCMEALSGEQERNDGKGCGGIMRIAPQALYEYQFHNCLPREKMWLTTKKMVAYTHHHRRAWLPAILFVDVLCLIMRGKADAEPLENIVRESMSAMKILLTNNDGECLVALVDMAFALAKRNLPDHEAIARLGAGRSADETLAIALYCVAKYPADFERAVVASVNHSGNSRSTGIVTGNIIGAMSGRDAIPQHFTDDLELIDIIEEMAGDVARGADICYAPPATRSQERWSQKYARPYF